MNSRMYKIFGVVAVTVLAAAAIFLACSDKDKSPVGPDDPYGRDVEIDPQVELDLEAWHAERERMEAEAEAYPNGTPIQLEGCPDGYTCGGLSQSETFVGNGINFLAGPTVKDAIIQNARNLSDDVYFDASNPDGTNKYIGSSAGINHSDNTFTISENVSEAYSNLKVTANIGTGEAVPFFSGKVEAQYGSERNVKSKTMFYNAYFWYVTNSHYLSQDYRNDINQLRTLIRPSVLAAVNGTLSAGNLFASYGTHIIMGYERGGVANISAKYDSDDEMTKQEISSSINVKTKWVEAGGSVASEDKQAKIANETSIKANASGGTGLVVTSLDGIGDALKEWKNTVPGNEGIASITDVVPIWELATNSTRRNALKDQFEANARARNLELNDYYHKGAAPPAMTLTAEKKYVIRNLLADKVIDVDGQSKDNEKYLHLWDRHGANGSKSQQWVVEASAWYPGWFRLRNENSGRYMQSSYGGWYADKDIVKNNTRGFYQGSPSNVEHFFYLFKTTDNTDGTKNLIAKSTGGYTEESTEFPNEQVFVYGPKSDLKNGRRIYSAATTAGARNYPDKMNMMNQNPSGAKWKFEMVP